MNKYKINFISIDESDKYLSFYKYKISSKKTFDIQIKNKQNVHLGHIKFYSKWRKYVYYPIDNILLTSECLITITNYILKLKLGDKNE
jgi:hypothetical protein